MDLRAAILQNVRDVDRLSEPDLRRVLPVLRQARDEAGRGLAAWLRKHEGTETYGVHQHRQLLAQLSPAIMTVEQRLGHAMLADLKSEGDFVNKVAFKNITLQAELGLKTFRDSAHVLRLDEARVLLDSNHVLMQRYPTSAARYAGRAGIWVQNQLAVGVVRGETVDQLTRRLLRGGDISYDAANRGGDTAVGEAWGERFFWRNRSDAERVVRTELVNAYGETQNQALEEANREDYGWLKRWDASNDRRTCPWCSELDGVTVRPEETFYGGFDHPPQHPFCRCCIVAWREEWPAWNQWWASKQAA